MFEWSAALPAAHCCAKGTHLVESFISITVTLSYFTQWKSGAAAYLDVKLAV